MGTWVTDISKLNDKFGTADDLKKEATNRKQEMRNEEMKK